METVKHALEVAAKKNSKVKRSGGGSAVEIDPVKGDISVYIGDKEIVSKEFGRIAAQTARQVIIQKSAKPKKKGYITNSKAKKGILSARWSTVLK